VTLTDLVADVRAATPSQAAELLVPDRAQQRAALERCERHLLRAQLSLLAAAHARLSRLTNRVSDPRFVIAARQQELDELSERMTAVLRQRLTRGRRSQHELGTRLAHRRPDRVVSRARGDLERCQSRLAAAALLQLGSRRKALAACAAQLDALSPLAVLGRGYAIATRAGVPVLASSELSPGDVVDVRVAHGSFRASVTRVAVPDEDASAAKREVLP